MSAPLRVLFAIPELDRGGPDAVFFNLLRTLDRDRFEPMLAVTKPTGGYLGELPKTLPVLAAGRGRYPVRSLVGLVRAVRPDLVMSTLRMNTTAAAASPFFGAGTTLVCRMANNVSADLRHQRDRSSQAKVAAIAALYRFWLNRADVVIAQTRAMADDIAARFGAAPAAKTVTLPNPVDVERLVERADAGVAVAPTGHPQLVSGGRLDPQKGFDLLIAAMPAVRERHPGARLWIVGAGRDRDALAAQAEALGVGDAVELVGFVDNPLPYYRAADLYVCSSRYEGFPNSVAEALAMGTPVVAPGGPAAGDELVTPTNGVLVDSATPATLAAGIAEALARKDRPGGFDPDAIQAECRDRFSVTEVTRRYEDTLLAAHQRTQDRPAGARRRISAGGVATGPPDRAG